jgi:DNA polymerase V
MHEVIGPPLEVCPPAKKSITCSRSFGRAVDSLADVREAVAFYMTRAVEKLRRGGLAASIVTTFVQTDRFSEAPQYYNAGTHTLAYPTDSTQELLSCALDALERIFKEGFKTGRRG